MKSSIHLLPPCSSRTRVLLITDKFVVFEKLLCFVSAKYTTGTHADVDDAGLDWITLWMLSHCHRFLVCVRHIISEF